MDFKAFSIALPSLLAASAAFAEPATPEGAAHLTEVFQTYLGTVEGVVTVVPEGETYTLTLDAAPLLAMAPAEAGSFSLTPLVMVLTDNGDGTWGVTQDQAMSLSAVLEGQFDIKLDIASATSEGVFDEAMMAYATSSGEFSGLTVVEKITPPGEPPVDVTITAASGTTTASATPNAEGGVDMTTDFTLLGMTQTMMMPPMGEGMPPMPITVSIESQEQSGDMTGFRPEAFLGLIAWAVAHPSEEAMQADMAGLKAVLEGGIPFFESLNSSGTMTNISVETPMGPVGIASATIEVDAHGVVEDGLFREAFTLSGLTLPEGVLPPWSVPLLPTDLALDVTVTGFDLASPAAIMMALFDMPPGSEPDPAMQDAALAALLPEGAVEITLAPGGVSGAGYELSYEGAMTAGPMAMPAGSATVTLTGIDAIMAALDAAPDDVKSQALPMIGMAQGMATPGPEGELVWEIDATTPGSLLINGMDMMGGP
jgi:hypothetical protein